MPLAASTTNVEQVPGDRLAMEINVEYVLRYTHGLDTGMEDVI